MATWRQIGGVWTDLDQFDDGEWRQIGGIWAEGNNVAAGGVTEIPNPLHQLDHQYATIQAHKLNGVLQS